MSLIRGKMDNLLTIKITQGTTLSLRRILRLLKSKDREMNKTSICKECNLSTTRINDSLKFLYDFNLIKKRYNKKRGVYLYKINPKT